MADDDVTSNELQRDPTGRPWAFPTPPGATVFVFRTVVRKFREGRKLGSQSAYLEARNPGRQLDIVRDAIALTLARSCLRTVAGALTRIASGEPPSIDYVAREPDVAKVWGAPVTAVVRRFPAGDGIRDGEVDAEGFVHVLVTITLRSPRWWRVVAGSPVTPETATHLIAPGRRFDPATMIDYRRCGAATCRCIPTR